MFDTVTLIYSFYYYYCTVGGGRAIIIFIFDCISIDIFIIIIGFCIMILYQIYFPVFVHIVIIKNLAFCFYLKNITVIYSIS